MSDHNLPVDKFLFESTQGTLAEDVQLSSPGTGWVALATLLSFKRMQAFQELGLAKIAQAVRDHTSDLVEVNPEGTKVKRTRAIAPATPGEALARSVYVKGFPAENEVEDLQRKLEIWFRKFGRVNQVRMRREGGNDLKQADGREFKVGWRVWMFCLLADLRNSSSTGLSVLRICYTRDRTSFPCY